MVVDLYKSEQIDFDNGQCLDRAEKIVLENQEMLGLLRNTSDA